MSWHTLTCSIRFMEFSKYFYDTLMCRDTQIVHHCRIKYKKIPPRHLFFFMLYVLHNPHTVTMHALFSVHLVTSFILFYSIYSYSFYSHIFKLIMKEKKRKKNGNENWVSRTRISLTRIDAHLIPWLDLVYGHFDVMMFYWVCAWINGLLLLWWFHC